MMARPENSKSADACMHLRARRRLIIRDAVAPSGMQVHAALPGSDAAVRTFSSWPASSWRSPNFFRAKAGRWCWGRRHSGLTTQASSLIFQIRISNSATVWGGLEAVIRRHDIKTADCAKTTRQSSHTRLRIPAARSARVVHESSARTRAWGMPDARCTRSLMCKIKKAHEVVTARFTGAIRHSRTQWF
jgi:hypothetical protein